MKRRGNLDSVLAFMSTDPKREWTYSEVTEGTDLTTEEVKNAVAYAVQRKSVTRVEDGVFTLSNGPVAKWATPKADRISVPNLASPSVDPILAVTDEYVLFMHEGKLLIADDPRPPR